ncbi:MAG TPA: enoyl-CoA hydratase-related protein, partial [Pararhizobium sp.]|nr:enoyl-CoA hydratase-related protein [Pararhizobium sp.]
AIGIGTTMQLHCDLSFATPRSQFRTPFVDLALVPEAGSSLLASLLMGHQRAFALLAAGIGFSAEEAREAGLIYRVIAEEHLEQTVLDAALTLARKPPEALRLARDLVRGPREEILKRIDEEVALFGTQLRSPEAKAALEAFLNRTKQRL